MARRFVVALAALVATRALAADDDICSVDISKCYIDGGSKTCNREKAQCPPCLAAMDGGFFGFLSSTKYGCYELNDDSECPDDTTLCSTTNTPSPTPTPTPKKTPKKTASSSGSNSSDDSGSGSTTPKPTTKKPSKTKSSSSSGSGSGSTTVKTPKPTPSPTPKPTPSPTPSPTATPSPMPTPTATQAAEEAASAPSNATASTDSDSSSGSKIGVILAIVGGCAVVVAVLGFFVWKRRQDDDDDSDDDEPRFPPPKAVYNQTSTATAAHGANAATAFSKPTNNPGFQGDMQTSPVRAPPPHSYAVPVAAAAPADIEYGIPVATSSTDYRVSDHNSHSSSEDGRDVWGNAVDSYRGKRTDSNVSVEF